MLLLLLLLTSGKKLLYTLCKQCLSCTQTEVLSHRYIHAVCEITDVMMALFVRERGVV